MTISLLIGVIFFLAGLVQGISGFGSALVAIPLLTFVIDIKEAIPLCTLLSLIITSYLAIQLRAHFQKKHILPLCLGALPGILLGATLLKTFPSAIIQFYLGLFLVLYSIFNLLFSPKARKLSPHWGYLAGFLSGAIGAAFSAGGPPTIIYATLNKWSKDQIKATLTGFFCFNSYMGAIAHATTGLTTTKVLLYFLIASPFVLLGTVAGSKFYGTFKHDSYLKVIFLFLLIMGILMMV